MNRVRLNFRNSLQIKKKKNYRSDFPEEQEKIANFRLSGTESNTIIT